jgi:ATP-binding cassette, subfamily B, bacterial
MSTSATAIAHSRRSPEATTQTLATWPVNLRLIRHSPMLFAVHSVFAVLFFVLQVLPGLIEKSIFDAITGQEPAITSLWLLIGLFVGVEAARVLTAVGADWFGYTFRLVVAALLRRNLFASILRRPGDQGLSVAPGEAINRLRDDVEEVSDFPTWLPDAVGQIAAALAAIAIMASINLSITLVVFLPLGATLLVGWFSWNKIRFYAHAEGQASDRVTGFLGEALGAAQAVKIADAELWMADQLKALNEVRQYAAVRRHLFQGVAEAVNTSAVSFGIGVMLLMAGRAMTAGSFTVGDFALFVFYLSYTTQLPSYLGNFAGDYAAQSVSIDRMVELVRPEPPQVLLEYHPVYMSSPPPRPPPAPKRMSDRLDTLTVLGLSYTYPGTQRGIMNVDLDVRHGEFVVITGRVGSGKSTLARVLLGLLPPQSGEIHWNGIRVDDPARFFVPPRCAYTSQVPRLFSDTIRDNILLGLPEGDVDLGGALQAAVLEVDVARLENGLDTLVGPRGVRLSGGQGQRAAAARMFVRQPELLVFDDLSSGLDIETEQLLWERLRQPVRGPDGAEGGTPTCLVVSHRRPALQHADRIIVMKDGRAVATGNLPDLLENCEEMRHLWSGARA